MTNKEAWYKFSGITTLVVLLYLAAVKFGFFWIFDWYDNAMHIIGGLAIGYLAIATAKISLDRNKMIIRVITFATVIGILWEVFERVGNHYVPTLLAYGGPMDTVLDVAYAIIGALVIVLIESRGKRP